MHYANEATVIIIYIRRSLVSPLLSYLRITVHVCSNTLFSYVYNLF
jgi:hypothetical protein